MNDAAEQPRIDQRALNRAAREIVDHLDGDDWDLAPRLYALVPTSLLLVDEPGLVAELDAAPLTPVEQEDLPEDVTAGSPALADYLAQVHWPDAVVGCVLAQDLLVVAPSAAGDADPEGVESRLIVGVLRGGEEIRMLHVRDDDAADPVLRTAPGLAAPLVEGLHATFL